MTVKERIERLFRDVNTSPDVYSLVKKSFNDEMPSFYLPIYRMLWCYKKEYVVDFLSNLRQVLLYIHRELQLPRKAIFWCEQYKDEYELSIDSDAKYVEAKAYAMSDVESLKYSYEFVKKRNNTSSISDSSLINFFGFESYISLQQKCMIYLSKQLKEGNTYLACLSTGSGKSLTWQLAVARGQFSRVTVVVVPTIALAYDHKRNDENTLKKIPWIESIAYSSQEYSSGEKMEELVDKIQNGKSKIIYISPEGITNPKISKALINAAKKKNISAIVIDETHLVIDWGMKFRPEFQFLPALINKLKMYSENTFVTMLLSATITENDKNVLDRLFGSDGIIEFRGDELRSEVEYYVQYCRDDNTRMEYLEQLIKTVPKPAIIYVGTIDSSKDIYEMIKKIDYKRVGLFHSEIEDKKKKNLLHEWEFNQIDIMVATSAFGMGVDKADVRTIITAYTPENLSRFYQEVGRAGRDGYAALNFWLFCPDVDSRIVSHYTDSKLIGSDNLADRWMAMRKNQVEIENDVEADCIWVDTDTAPEQLEFDKTGAFNVNWNEDAISLMTRASLVDIIDIRRYFKDNHRAFRIKLRIKKEYLYELNDKDSVIKCIDDFRNAEREEINDEKYKVNSMLKDRYNVCFSDYFVSEFSYSNRVCVGCPYCRKNENTELVLKGNMSVFMHFNALNKESKFFLNNISQAANGGDFGYFSFDEELSNNKTNELIARGIIAGIRIIVVPDTNIIDMNMLKTIPEDNYMILNYEEFFNIPKEIIFGSLMIFLCSNKTQNGKLIKIAKRISESDNCSSIIVAPSDYYDEVEKRYLSDFTEYGKKVNVILQEDIIC